MGNEGAGGVRGSQTRARGLLGGGGARMMYNINQWLEEGSLSGRWSKRLVPTCPMVGLRKKGMKFVVRQTAPLFPATF